MLSTFLALSIRHMKIKGVSLLFFILVLGNLVNVLAWVPLDHLNGALIQINNGRIRFLPGILEGRRLKAVAEAAHSQGLLTKCLGSHSPVARLLLSTWGQMGGLRALRASASYNIAS